MPDLSELYQRPVGSAPRPRPLPDELYPGIIKTYAKGTCSRPKISNLPVPCLTVTVGLLDWPSGVPESARSQDDGNGGRVDIDISKRQFNIDMPTPSDFSHSSWFYLDQFLRSCGLDGMSYEEAFPKLIGQRVTVDLGHYTNQRTNEIANQVNKIFGPVNTR